MWVKDGSIDVREGVWDVEDFGIYGGGFMVGMMMRSFDECLMFVLEMEMEKVLIDMHGWEITDAFSLDR